MNESSPKKISPSESNEVTKPQASEAQPQTARKWLRRFLLAPVLPLLVIGSAWVYENSGRIVSTENAYVKANITPITSNVSGPVSEVMVRENQLVKAGDPLFRLNATPYRYALEAAEAELSAARIDVEGLKSDYRQYGVEMKEAGERVRLNKLKYKRQQTLQSKNVGRKTQLEEARYNLAAARQHQRSIREYRRKALNSLRGNSDLPVDDHPTVQEKSALTKRAALNLANTNIFARANGIISNLSLRVGEYVRSGAPVFSLVETSNLWVEANLKETQLTHIEVGQEAEFIADSYPDVIWSSRVITISPATGAEFSLLPPQNASGNWVKVVQRLPVRFSVSQREGKQALRAGMTVTVSIDTKRERRVADLWQDILVSSKELQEKYLAFNIIK